MEQLCKLCGINKRTSNGKGKLKSICSSCHKGNYRLNKANTCSVCGFIAVDKCQLDIHHIDFNHHNNSTENLITVCANCHRLKHNQAKL